MRPRQRPPPRHHRHRPPRACYRGRVINEISAEIPLVAVPKMKVSYLLDILVGGVCDIDELPVGEVGKKVPIGLPPVLGRLGCLWWHGDSVG